MKLYGHRDRFGPYWKQAIRWIAVKLETVAAHMEGKPLRKVTARELDPIEDELLRRAPRAYGFLAAAERGTAIHRERRDGRYDYVHRARRDGAYDQVRALHDRRLLAKFDRRFRQLLDVPQTCPSALPTRDRGRAPRTRHARQVRSGASRDGPSSGDDDPPPSSRDSLGRESRGRLGVREVET
jgi:hypothetical protein